MNDFEVLTYQAVIEPHPDADRIEIARIGDFQAIVQKGTIKDGDVIAYIPTDSIVPEELLEEIGLAGKLSGSQKNRVKPKKLRGIFSEGIVYPMVDRQPGEDVTEELGIAKYSPIDKRKQFFGQKGDISHFAEHASNMTLHYSMQNIKKWPDIIQKDDPVVMTEKLHGTWCCTGLYEDKVIITSKGLSGKDLILLDNNSTKDSAYMVFSKKILPLVEELKQKYETDHAYILGEIFGPGVQDLGYGLTEKEYRIFDIHIGRPRMGYYLCWDDMVSFLDDRFSTVPLLYKGPFSKEKLAEITSGNSMIGGNMREGTVVKADPSEIANPMGRVIFKSINEDYLLRKGGTEYQ